LPAWQTRWQTRSLTSEGISGRLYEVVVSWKPGDSGRFHWMVVHGSLSNGEVRASGSSPDLEKAKAEALEAARRLDPDDRAFR